MSFGSRFRMILSRGKSSSKFQFLGFWTEKAFLSSKFVNKMNWNTNSICGLWIYCRNQYWCQRLPTIPTNLLSKERRVYILSNLRTAQSGYWRWIPKGEGWTYPERFSSLNIRKGQEKDWNAVRGEGCQCAFGSTPSPSYSIGNVLPRELYVS